MKPVTRIIITIAEIICEAVSLLSADDTEEEVRHYCIQLDILDIYSLYFHDLDCHDLS